MLTGLGITRVGNSRTGMYSDARRLEAYSEMGKLEDLVDILEASRLKHHGNFSYISDIIYLSPSTDY